MLGCAHVGTASVFILNIFWLTNGCYYLKIETGKQLEAFSIQLVILAIWKQALHICHTQAASAIEGSPIPDTNRFREVTKEQGSIDIHEHLDLADSQVPQDIYSGIERAFLLEVGNAEELAKVVEPGTAIETLLLSQ